MEMDKRVEQEQAVKLRLCLDKSVVAVWFAK